MVLRTFGLLAIAIASLACNPSPPALINTEPAAEALARRVLLTLAENDRSALVDLALTEAEFQSYVWPLLPASRPERNLPFSYVWGDFRQKSAAAMQRTMATHAGRRYDLERVEFDRPATNYGPFTVYRDSRFLVREPNGQRHELKLSGSFFEMGGRWKLFSFVVDD